ncbi:hypothetical protein [Paraburkholderia azotifigens]|uniref:Uncharacterized protein n=1 Tax=Paraburkholderia azotifigens TaxID=2057004 RepID=A0A5C6VKC2_9BURK|nr:hypothetical protein [Paraburkholderia azotifigens]TXC85479.1 hypothetical protein FRZ40_16735 [Paraburkholderia azotifigens]
MLHSSLSDKGEFLVYDVDLASGERAEFRLHECVAHNMLSFMMNMMINGARLTGEVQGAPERDNLKISLAEPISIGEGWN